MTNGETGTQTTVTGASGVGGIFGYLGYASGQSNVFNLVNYMEVHSTGLGQNYIDYEANKGNTITAGYMGTGGIAGTAASVSIFIGHTVKNHAPVSSAADIVSGIFGNLSGNSDVQGLVNDQPVTGTDNVGGIAGVIAGNTNVFESYNTGTVTATAATGYAGGLAGGLYGTGTMPATLTDSYNLGTISGSNAGGIVGKYESTDPANLPFITNTYNAGAVKGTNSHGFVGEVSGTPTTEFADNYFDTSTSGHTATDGGYATGIIGQNTKAMTELDGGTWRTGAWGAAITDKNTYPYLAWQLTTGASNNINFTSISPKADATATTNQTATINLTGATNPATKLFNVYGGSPANFSNFSNLSGVNTVNTASTAGAFSIGVMSESGIVAFELTTASSLFGPVVNPHIRVRFKNE
jgi:hypothetical protein